MAPSHANQPRTNKYLTLIDMGKVTKYLKTTELETCASFLGRSVLHKKCVLKYIYSRGIL